MAEYTGEVVPFDAPVNPATGKPTGSVVNKASEVNTQQVQSFGNDIDSWQSWLNNPAGWVAAGGAATEAARRMYPYLKDKLKGPQVPDVSGRIEPTMETPVVERPVVNTLADLEARVNASRAPVPPQAPPPAPVPVEAPVAPPVPATPVQTAANIMAGEPPIAAAVSDPLEVAQQVESKAPRLSKAERFAKQAAVEAATPPGMRVVPENPRFNKAPGEKIGVGGYTYAHGAFGPETEARWLEQYGPKNVPYEQVRKDISAARMGPYPEGVSPEFKYNRPQYAPEFIKGGISPAMALGVAANALGAYGIGKQVSQGDYAGAGVSAFLQALSNFAPKLGLGASLMAPSTVSSGTLNSPEAQQLMKRAVKPY